MKKKVLSVVLTLVLALGVVFTAIGCGSSLDVYKTADKTYAPYAAATKVDALEGFDNDAQEGNLVLFSKDSDAGKDYKIFDLSKGSVIASVSIAAEDWGFVGLLDVPAVEQTLYATVIRKANEEKTTYKLYSQSAVEIASVITADPIQAVAKLDLVKLGNTYYRVSKDGSVVKAFEISDLGRFDLDILNYKAAGYYYAKIDGNFGQVIYAFKENGELASYYQIPSFAENISWSVMNNGNIFVQYVVQEDNFSEDYDYIDDLKYSIEQFVVNPKNGEAKSVKDSKNLVYSEGVSGIGIMYDMEYEYPWATEREAGIAYDGYTGSIKNFAYGYKVINKRIDEATDTYFEVSDSGKFSEIEDFIPALRNVSYRYGYYFVSNKLNQTFLYNSDAKLIGEISGANGWNIKFIYTDKAVYDYSLNKVLDLEDYDIIEVLESTIILSKTTTVDNEEVVEYFLLKEGAAPAKICNANDFFGAEDKYYVVLNSDGKLDCYNEVGTKLLTFEMPAEEPEAPSVSIDGAKMLINLNGVYYYVA